MEIVVILAFLGLFFVAPITMSIIALSKVRGLRLKVENLERSSARRELRVERAVAPVPEPPLEPVSVPVAVVERPEVASSLQPLHPRILRTPPAPRPAPPPPPVVVETPKPEPAAPRKEIHFENVIGERILPRVGVVAIVFGLALLVWYAWGRLGPEGKIALTASTGVTMVVGGAILRRNPLTRLLGSCLIGGGWSVLYITAYASHAIPASQVIRSPLLGFIVLLGVAEAALLHALRYRSETIAGLAYLLTIATLLISPAPIGAAAGWSAIGLSGAILLAIAWKEKWIRLCVFGAKLLYVAEAVWLSRTVQQPDSILIALGVLALLWLMWTIPSYFHKPKSTADRVAHGMLVGINSIGLLVSASLIQRWFSLEYMGWVWILLGTLSALSAFAGRSAAWRPAHLANLAMAAILLAVGTRLELTGLGPAVAWSGIAVSLFAWGMWRRDALPRLMGIVALAATFLAFWGVDRELAYAAWPAVAFAALGYAMAGAMANLRDARPFEKRLAMPLSHFAAVALGLAIWKYAPHLTAASFFAIGGVALLWLAPRLRANALVAEGVVFLTLPVFFLVARNLEAAGEWAGMSNRVVSTLPVLFAWFAARRFAPASTEVVTAGRYFGFLLFAGVLTLLSCELGIPQSPVACAVACAAWFAWGRLTGRNYEVGLAAGGAAVCLAMFVLAPELQVPVLGWTGPVASGSILGALLIGMHLASRPFLPPLRDAFSVSIAATVFMILAREVTGPWLAGSWAILGVALAVYGLAARDRVSRWTSLLSLGAGLCTMAAFDPPMAAVFWAWASGAWFLWSRVTKSDLESTLAAVSAAGALLGFAAAPTLVVPLFGWTGPVAAGAILVGIFVAIHLASKGSKVRDVFGAAIAITGFTLLAREMTGTQLTGSWAVLGFALSAYGFIVRDRVSRWSSLLVLGICLGKVAIFDLASFDMPVKIATLLTMGTVMVVLSFIYARHHRRIMGYLSGNE